MRSNGPGVKITAMRTLTLFLCGDVMTGRGIDQILPHPCEPSLYEQYMRTALGYVHLAEHRSGAINYPVGFDYIWGDALTIFDRIKPDARIVNLETAITTAEEPWPGKGIHYRMHPANIPCLTMAKIDCCALANNHVLDWGYGGLLETLGTLHLAGLRTAGAGHDAQAAQAPATIELARDARVLVYGFGLESAGVPAGWAARAGRAGVSFLHALSDEAARAIAAQIKVAKKKGDIVIVSLHWGPNWGYRITDAQRSFAHHLIDDAAVDIVHGHSSHHPIGIEVYRGKLILYSCGDFLNDYEGIDLNHIGDGDMRSDLTLMYFPVIDVASGQLTQMHMTPLRIRKFHLERASRSEAQSLHAMLNREGHVLNTAADHMSGETLALRWH